MTTHYVLIDYENVPLRSLALLSGTQFRVLVFLGPHNRNLPTEFVMAVQKLGNRAEYISLEKSGKNALDFHITYYLGTLTAADPSGCFRIISADTGFDSLLQHLRMQQIDADKVASIEELPGLAPAAAAELAPANPKPGAGTTAKPARKTAAKAAPVAAVTVQASAKPARTARKAATKTAVEPGAEAAASPAPEQDSNPPTKGKPNIDPERIRLDPDPLTCSARIRSQADTVTQADERSFTLQGETVTQARGGAPRNPCSTMPSETPAAPPTRSQRETVRTGHDEVKTSSCRINNANISIGELVKLVVENLTKRKSSRPSTVKTLMNSIKSICGDGVETTKVDAVYEALRKNGYLAASGTKITYPAPQ